MKTQKILMLCIAGLCIVLFTYFFFTNMHTQEFEEPYATSSISNSFRNQEGEEVYKLELKIIYSKPIEDKNEFAQEIFELTQENDLKGILLSVDINGYPSELEVDVYESEKDIQNIPHLTPILLATHYSEFPEYNHPHSKYLLTQIEQHQKSCRSQKTFPVFFFHIWFSYLFVSYSPLLKSA